MNKLLFVSFILFMGCKKSDSTQSNGSSTMEYKTVIGANGRIWMDRNLGASQVATSISDAQSYGDLYQWGRGSDGHEKRNSSTSTTSSTKDVPGNGSFIMGTLDWRSPKNDNLWQGVNGINNPCPAGFRIPTEAEWKAEIASWSNSNPSGAFASSLKLPMAGGREGSNGVQFYAGIYGYYWSSTVSGDKSQYILLMNSFPVSYFGGNRNNGSSCRCIKN
jgi:uncharacterized protein (TIGR02145 family)